MVKRLNRNKQWAWEAKKGGEWKKSFKVAGCCMFDERQIGKMKGLYVLIGVGWWVGQGGGYFIQKQGWILTLKAIGHWM